MTDWSTADLAERDNGRLEQHQVETDDGTIVQMGLPASPRFLRLARLTGASLGADLGLSLDEIEDLRVAVDELCAAAIEDAPAGSMLQLEFRTSTSHLALEGSVLGTWDEPFVLHPVAAALLEIVADEFSLDQQDGRRSFQLQAKRPSHDANG